MSQSIKIYLGVPQTEKIPVLKVDARQRVTATKMIFTNTEDTDAKLTITVNTIDIMKNFVVKAGETKFLDVSIVLDPNDTLLIKQEKENAINVNISGVAEIIPVTY
ncbi:TPA: hypothetical protein ACGXMH_004546 [Bacillus mobilis]|uniref:hypothetical protein n=1 Tax=Bacillus mobilis TaxID=2026190 RepID=UPI0008197E79|nr:hypothetical protein [Bacillus mobilis]ANY29982.1 hypothetical protein [Phage Wrath]HDX9643003.1 hypothetical protein [Bacillus mobilis]